MVRPAAFIVLLLSLMLCFRDATYCYSEGQTEQSETASGVLIPDDPDFWWRELEDDPLCLCADSYFVDPDSTNYTVVDGVLLSKDQKILYRYPPEKLGWYYLVPSTVIRIEDSAFMYSMYLEEIAIPDSVLYLDGCDTFNRSSIKRIHLPPSIKSFNIEGIARTNCLEEIVVKKDSLCWKELAAAKDYIDFFNLGMVVEYR